MFRKGSSLLFIGVAMCSLAGSAMAQKRVSTTQKGSLLIFSKVEIKWDADGKLIQDTIVDITNDYPEDVYVQAYFINGDLEIEEVCADDQCTNIVQNFEPGWNTADCRFLLTGNQPHFWSAANGSDKCQAFTVLDPEGPGRLDPETGGTARVLRGYALYFAVAFDNLGVVQGGPNWRPIRWNHLKGDAVVANYENGAAWEYNAWSFPAEGGSHGEFVLTGDGALVMFGSGGYSRVFDTLMLDFYASGSTVLSGGGQTVMVDTDLTLHPASIDLRQDGCGPVLTKVEAEIWNEFESKFSGTRRCICCWDETMLSDWVRSVAVPNHFLRSTLRTDKGKARLDGVASTECDYEALCGPTATIKRRQNFANSSGTIRCDRSPSGMVAGGSIDHFDEFAQSQNIPLLGVVTKSLSFSPSGDKDLAGMNLVGMGVSVQHGVILYDVLIGPHELGDTGRANTGRGGKAGTIDRNARSRGTVEVPAE